MPPAPSPDPTPAPRLHQPLSVTLLEILAHEPPPGGLTLNTLFACTAGRGIFLLVILLCLPFLVPVSLPGLSTLLGTVILLLAVRLAFDLPPRLPRWIGERPLPARFNQVLSKSVTVLRFLEKWIIRPRRTFWLSWRLVKCGNGLVLVLMAFCLALPIPPVIPLTNTLPAYAIVFVALSMMEEDGAMIWLGYGVAVGTLLYFYAWADAIAYVFQKYYTPVMDWMGRIL